MTGYNEHGIRHTSDLADALAEAVHHTSGIHADAVHFDVLQRDADQAPTRYRATCWRGLNRYWADAATPIDALSAAMNGLRAATGGAV